MQSPGRGTSEQRPDALTSCLGLEVQQRAVQGVSGGTGRHRGLQSLPVEPLPQGFPHRQERGQRSLRRLAIAGIGDAFAAPGMAAPADFRHHRDRLGLGAAADSEAACDRPLFDSGDKRCRFTGSHFKFWQFLNGRVAGRNQVWLVRGVFYKAAARRVGSFPSMNSGESAQELA